MVKIKNNAVTRGFSGKLGEDLVFLQVDNKTVFSKRTLSSKRASAGQLKIRTKFTEAAHYASATIDNEEPAQDYQLMADLAGLKSAIVLLLPQRRRGAKHREEFSALRNPSASLCDLAS